MTAAPVLSLFPGIDLLGRGFEAAGYCVVRGPDPIQGGDVRRFHPPAGYFEGVIGGPPCQEFSRMRRKAHNPATGYGLEMIEEFSRVVKDTYPLWFLMENVPGLPDTVSIGGPDFDCQRFHLCASECGGRQRRLRVFIFGSRERKVLVIERRPHRGPLASTCLASEGEKPDRRGWPEFCELQGLPASFELPGMSTAAKYRAVGNGVPVFMAEHIAQAIRSRVYSGSVRLCLCGCGRRVSGRADKVAALVACRKRLERTRTD